MCASTLDTSNRNDNQIKNVLLSPAAAKKTHQSLWLGMLLIIFKSGDIVSKIITNVFFTPFMFWPF